jgi:hypothetical protein
MIAFWDVAPCSFLEVDRSFGGVCCFHHQDDSSVSTRLHGAMSQKAVIFKEVAFLVFESNRCVKQIEACRFHCFHIAFLG